VVVFHALGLVNSWGPAAMRFSPERVLDTTVPAAASTRRRAMLQRAVALSAAVIAVPRAYAQSGGVMSAQDQMLELKRDLPKWLPELKFESWKEGRVHIDVPAVAESGLSVPCTVAIDSPMTADDHVKQFYMWALRNPRPIVVQMQFSAGMPVARFETRLRLGESQRLIGIAQMHDDVWWSGHADLTVLASACQDGSG
jgi:predicted secreted protein